MSKIRVLELFAGVGGFRLGLDSVGGRTKKIFETVWSNQWEPNTSIQYANDIYRKRFGHSGRMRSQNLHALLLPVRVVKRQAEPNIL